MLRPTVALLLLLAAAPAQEQTPARILRDLMREFRALDLKSPGFTVQKMERMRILSRVADIDDPRAAQFLVDVAKDPRHIQLHADLRTMMAERLPDSPEVAELFRGHMEKDDAHRLIARKYLLARAIRKRDDIWLQRLFDRGTIEDRFIALDGLGRIGSMTTLTAATTLAHDTAWKPVSGTVVNCGTIVTAVRGREGAEAARLMLVLRRDPRFTRKDEEALREATRLWGNRNLKTYVRIDALAETDPEKRAETARFMGQAGIEAARAPLVRMARSSFETPAVRAAAAEALGGLAIAPGDLVATLADLAVDPDEQVARGAVRGLGRLRVRQAAETLVDLLDGPVGADARKALATLSKEPEETDWAVWLQSCTLPRGT